MVPVGAFHSQPERGCGVGGEGRGRSRRMEACRQRTVHTPPVQIGGGKAGPWSRICQAFQPQRVSQGSWPSHLAPLNSFPPWKWYLDWKVSAAVVTEARVDRYWVSRAPPLVKSPSMLTRGGSVRSSVQRRCHGAVHMEVCRALAHRSSSPWNTSPWGPTARPGGSSGRHAERPTCRRGKILTNSPPGLPAGGQHHLPAL